MKVLHCLGSMRPSHGGPPRVVEGLALGLADQGTKVSILGHDMAYDHDTFVRDWPRLGAHPNVHFLKAGIFKADPGGIGQFDHVHFHGLWDYFFLPIARACRAQNIPYSISPHGCLDPWSLRQKALKKKIGLWVLGYKRFLDQAASVFLATQDEADKAANQKIKAPLNILTNGVEAFWHSGGMDGDLPAAARPVLACDTTLIFFSRIHKKKGVDLLVEAFAACTDQHPNLGLLVVGIAEDPHLAAHIQTRAKPHDRIYITTELTGPAARAVLNQSDCFVLPTFQEGFSIAVLEAMAAGLPVMITPACRLPVVIENAMGWECDPNVAAIQACLAQIAATSPDQMHIMGQRAKTYVRDHHAWPGIARILLDHYTQASG